MKRALGLLEQVGDVVESEPRAQPPQIASHHPVWRAAPGLAPGRQASTQRIVDDLAKRPPAAPRLGLELAGHVFVQRQGGSHFVMLFTRHHDVKIPDGRESG